MDAHYVSDEMEPLMNEPHGYLTTDDVIIISKFLVNLISHLTAEIYTIELQWSI